VSLVKGYVLLSDALNTIPRAGAVHRLRSTQLSKSAWDLRAQHWQIAEEEEGACSAARVGAREQYESRELMGMSASCFVGTGEAFCFFPLQTRSANLCVFALKVKADWPAAELASGSKSAIHGAGCSGPGPLYGLVHTRRLGSWPCTDDFMPSTSLLCSSFFSGSLFPFLFLYLA
jgi:hypothetical protein